MNLRAVLLASGLALLLPLALSGRAAADQPPVSPPASVATARLSKGALLSLPPSLRLTWLRQPGPVGVNLRLRLPMPIVPYLEGRLGDGMSAARPDGALMIPGTPIGLSGSAAGGWPYSRGIDLGFDIHRFHGGYLSVAVGWLRSSWPVGGLDDRGRFLSRYLTSDGFVFKVGVSF